MRPKIKLIQPLGFCYGVKRAVNLADQALKTKSNKRIYSLGGIIHNRDAVQRLSQKGLIVRNNLRDVKKGDMLIISSHGTEPVILKTARKRGINIIDATCPNVITAQRFCQRLRDEDYFIIIVGDKKHKEVKSLRGFAGTNSMVIKDEKELRRRKIGSRKIGVVVQTTQSQENFVKILKTLITRDLIELRIFNTICNDTAKRQRAASNLARKVDAIFVVGGKHSANTRRLFELCKKIRHRCFHIENDRELRLTSLRNSKMIGIISGASTPDWVIGNVLEKIRKFK